MTSKSFFLSYEGVWEVCPLCGDPQHFPNSFPKRPPPCLELVVAQLDDAKLYVNVAGVPTEGGTAPTDWLAMVPRRGAKPRAASKRNPPKFQHYPTANHVKPLNSPIQNMGHGLPVIPLANTFQGLQDFQVSTGDTLTMNPLPCNPMRIFFQSLIPKT